MFTHIDQKKVYLQVINQIKNSIHSGQLKKGDKLPSERQMADQMGVSRATVREAIRALEITGLVNCLQGDGNFITESVENCLIEPVSIMFMLNKGKVNEIIELRRALELEAVKLAAIRISESSVAKLEMLCDLMEKENDESLKSEKDRQFHYEIASASENILIINILNAASFLIDELIKDIRIKINSCEKNKGIINYQHRSIAKALKEKDSDNAVTFMTQHMELIERFIDKNKNLPLQA